MQPGHRPHLQQEAPWLRAPITSTGPFLFHLLSLGGIYDSTIPCNSVYNSNHYLFSSINIHHMSDFKHFCFKLDTFLYPSFYVYFEAFNLCVILSKYAMYIDIKIEISGVSIDMQK